MVLLDIDRFIFGFYDAHEALYLTEGVFFSFVFVNLRQLLQQKVHFAHSFLNQLVDFLFEVRTDGSVLGGKITSSSPRVRTCLSGARRTDY